MYTIKKTVEFDAAHWLRGYVGKCANLHGHRWRAEVTFSGVVLNDLGLLRDFNDVKLVVEKFDHKVLNEVPPFDVINPTAENIARIICEDLGAAMVRVWETPSSEAVYAPGE